MLRSMYAAISGLKNFQTQMDVVGNNIANVNTYGFKKSRTTFSDLVSQQISGASSPQTNQGGVNPKQIGLGSTMGSIDTLHSQGSLETTGRDLDLAISGDGFFIADKGGANYYTRAGNMYLDQQGNLVTSDGLYIQGYSPDNTGKIDTSKLSNLKIDSSSYMVPKATTSATITGNLSNTATDPVPVKLNVMDSQGTEHSVTLTFTPKGTSNQWSYAVSSTDPDLTNLKITQTAPLKFNNNGQLTSPMTLKITSNLTNGTNSLNMNVDLSQITQVNDGNSMTVADIDGNSKGFLESYSIGASGEITGVYSNGDTELLGQIALANFSNPEGLTKDGNNLYSQSNNSGLPNIGVAGQGRGTLTPGALEMSNVDLSEEFTNMIVAQRGFQANARVITTSDQILQELVNLKQ